MGRLPRIFRDHAAPTAVLVIAALFLSVSPAPAATGDRFAGYTPAVRDQADRVVAAAAPGTVTDLEKQVRTLRKLMYAQGILSINAIPDLIFERAVREGWRKRASASLRIVTVVAPLSAPLWALLVEDDLLEARVDDLPHDFEGLAGAMRQFAPALLGYGAWLASYLAAAICWFVAWASIALFLRARPAFESDLSRVIVIPPRDVVAAALATAVFLLPLAGGVGLAVAACFWLVLSAGYLRRGEMVIVGAVVLFLAALLAAGGVIQSVNRMGSDVRRGGWLGGEGYFPQEWPADAPARRWALAGPSSSWMVKFAKARAAMIAGDSAASERLWTELVRAGKDLPEVYNNRGVCLAMQGKTAEGLADFETALARRGDDGPALWNAYQVYLQTFNLERAHAVQPRAWDCLQKLSPYGFRPAEMEPAEWVASALPARELWRSFLESGSGPAYDVSRSDIFPMFFRPLKPSGALVFLVTVFLAAVIWKILSLRIWVHTTCRSCGARSLVAGARDSFDPCNQCRAQIGAGVKGGLERDRRVQWIRMHRRYVRICSVLVPGSGALWAGKDLRALCYGIILALALGGISASAGPGEGGAIVSELRHTVTVLAAAVAACAWLAGVVWGIRSFDRFQARYNVGMGRG